MVEGRTSLLFKREVEEMGSTCHVPLKMRVHEPFVSETLMFYE